MKESQILLLSPIQCCFACDLTLFGAQELSQELRVNVRWREARETALDLFGKDGKKECPDLVEVVKR